MRCSHESLTGDTKESRISDTSQEDVAPTLWYTSVE